MSIQNWAKQLKLHFLVLFFIDLLANKLYYSYFPQLASPRTTALRRIAPRLARNVSSSNAPPAPAQLGGVATSRRTIDIEPLLHISRNCVLMSPRQPSLGHFANSYDVWWQWASGSALWRQSACVFYWLWQRFNVAFIVDTFNKYVACCKAV